MNNDEILGFEYDWLGIDASGAVGFFSTAGGGAAPRAFLENTEAFQDIIEEILATPKTTEARLQAGLDPHADDWKAMAERGLYAFDSDFFGGPYRLVAAPAVPIAVVQFPERVSRLLRLIVVPAVVFRSAIEIDSKGIGD